MQRSNAFRFDLAVEDMFSRIAKIIDGIVPEGSRSHRELLEQMTLAIEGKRPPVITDETAKILEQLQAFRHRFVHAYPDTLEWEKMRATVSLVPECMHRLSSEMQTFREYLGAAASAAQDK